MSLFQTIRTACRAVADQAEHVRINEDRIADYAASLPLDTHQPSLDPAHHFRVDPETTLAFVLMINAINFGSGYFPHLKKRPGHSGYRTVAASLSDWFEQRKTVSPHDLLDLTTDQCCLIFGQGYDSSIGQGNDPTSAARELMGLFANALRDLGTFVIEHHGRRFERVVESVDHSAERLVRELERMPYYRDVHRYGDLAVPFYKRAQITAADLSVAFADHPWGRFEDLDQLTIFADNLVPHVLHLDGILTFADDLVDRINREDIIPLGSREEIEIRACALSAVEMILQVRRDRGHHTLARDVDFLLWNRGQQPHYKAHPRHRSRGVYY